VTIHLVDPDTCEHGLSAALCCGPSHYPSDDRFYYEDDISERYAGERLDWDYYEPTDAELLFTPDGLSLLSPEYCNAMGGFHTLRCPNQPSCPF
jgi:hypothetical protein